MVDKSNLNAIHTQENESAILRGKDLTTITNANFSQNDVTSGGSPNTGLI